MAVMLSKTYAAFKAAGVPDVDAQAAAEEMADFQTRLAGIEGKLTVLLVVVGINAAATIATFGMLWQLAALVARLPSH
jgi:hypothetical protein